MAIGGTYKIDHLIYKFENFGSNDLIESNSWKIDSYKVQADHYDLLVCNSNQTIDLNEFQLVNDQITGFFSTRLYIKDDKLVYSLVRTTKEESFLMYLFQENKISLLLNHVNDGGYIAFEYLIHIIQNISIYYDRLPIHSVLLEYQGQGIIISADSGVGKSTHARLWRDYEHAFIINGDRSFVHKEDGKWIGVGYPWCGSSGEFMNRSVPVKAIVMLKRGKENKAYRISSKNALPQVLGQIFYPSHDFGATLKVLDMLDELLTDVPVYQLECDISKEAVDVLKEAIFSE